jgi:hypothetical protein
VTDPQSLVDADLLAWAVVLEYRRQQQKSGITILLLPYPPCPVCRRPVHRAEAWWVMEPMRGNVTITLEPCGHDQRATLAAVERVHPHLAAMLTDLEREVRDTDAIVREAHNRVGLAADDEGPTVQEAAAADRRWDLEKAGE